MNNIIEKLTLVHCFNATTKLYVSAYVYLPHVDDTLADISREEFKRRLQDLSSDLVPEWEGTSRCWS